MIFTRAAGHAALGVTGALDFHSTVPSITAEPVTDGTALLASSRPTPNLIHSHSMKKPAVKLGLTALLLAIVSVSGCNRPLLSPQETRSPFDSYDSVRGQYATQKTSDEFGREKPNIYQRLSPKY